MTPKEQAWFRWYDTQSIGPPARRAFEAGWDAAIRDRAERQADDMTPDCEQAIADGLARDLTEGADRVAQGKSLSERIARIEAWKVRASALLEWLLSEPDNDTKNKTQTEVAPTEGAAGS